MSNGGGYSGATIRSTEQKGWVCFRLEDGSPSDIELSELLAKTVAKWIRQNPRRDVVSTAAIVSGGRTVGFNLWYQDQ